MTRRLSISHSLTAPSALKNQTFEVVCFCGETLVGQRELHYQAISCPHCGKPVFVLPADCYAESATRRPPASIGGTSSEGVIDKLNRLAFWTRLREGRTAVGGQLCSMASRVGRWLKRRFSSFRG